MPRLLPIALILLTLASAAPAQGVHKWVDADGKVHYGSQPPADAKSEELKLRNRPAAPAAQTKPVPAGVREMEAGIVKGLSQVKGGAELNCDKAAANTRDQIDTMLEVGQKNMRDGYLKPAEYEATAAKMRETKAQISAYDCKSASGAKKDFYTCMSSSSNHLIGCGQKHRF